MRLYGRYKVTLPGEEYLWEPDEVTLGEQLMIETETDTTYNQWIMDGIRLENAIPCQILLWFLRRKAGRQEDRMAVEFPIRKLEIERLPDEDEGDADPEALAASEAAGSPSSPATTASDRGTSTDFAEATST